MKKRFVVLEDRIPYDWDDYDLWGVVAYDSENDEIVKGKYGHGQDWSDRKDSIELAECTDDEKMTIKKCLCKRYAHVDKFLSGVTGTYWNIPVKVVRGRKMNGMIGNLMSVTYEENTYMKRQHPWRSWGDYYGCVKFDGVHDPICIRVSYLQVESLDKCNEIVAERMAESDKITIERLAHIGAYEMSYSACDTKSARLEPLALMQKVLPL